MDKFFSIAILGATIRMATPLILAALGGCFSERAGVVNIALEGIMTLGAFAAVLGSYLTGNAWIGLIVAVIVGGLLGYIHAVFSVEIKANQVISGTALNLFAGGATIYLLKVIFKAAGSSSKVQKLADWGEYPPTVFIAFAMVVLSWIILYKTPFGLRLRTVGEHPAAADTVGVDVYRMRYAAVIISGVLGGIAGAHLSIGVSDEFSKNMVSGRGFIALAAMIAGRWHPVGACIAAVLFGYFDKLSMSLSGSSIFGVSVPSQFVSMLPYVITIVVLGVAGAKSVGPKAGGIPYEKGER
ncbi:MAG: ABC transporter permease [Clostridiales bacterium]|nr:ABC transporter permease [Clostridiales bacterium]